MIQAKDFEASIHQVLMESAGVLQEAREGRSAWKGDLKNIDDLLGWMYDKDLLTKTDKTEKDSLFRRYYRYYNDGDFPRGIKDDKGVIVSREAEASKIESALEYALETFVKRMLSKYAGRYDRGEFYLDRKIGELNIVLSVAERYDAHGLFDYWKKSVEDPATLSIIESMREPYESLKATIKSIDSSLSSYNVSYAREKMQASKTWTDEMERDWKEIQSSLDEIIALLKNALAALDKAKKIKSLNL